MTEPQNITPEGDDIELLLPWFATGKLTETEMKRVDAAIDSDAELMQRLGLVREEFDETIRLNEALGAPSRQAAARLFTRIDAEAKRPLPVASQAAALLQGLQERVGRFFLVPRPVLAMAAAVVIVAQAGFLTALVLRTPAGTPAGTRTYQTASAPEPAAAPGRLALVGFAPSASAADITGLLQRNHVSIIDGPKAGLFTLRVGDAKMTLADRDRVLAALRQTPGLVTFAVPKE